MHKVTWREGLIIAALAAPLALLCIGAIGIAVEGLAASASTPAMCRVE